MVRKAAQIIRSLALVAIVACGVVEFSQPHAFAKLAQSVNHRGVPNA